MFAKVHSGFQRSKIFVNRKAQGRLMLRFVGYWLVYHFVLIHTLLIFDFVRTRIELMNSGLHTSFSEMYSTFWAKYYPLAVSAVLLLPFLMYDILKSTHRIVGPLIRFENIFKKLQAGERVENVKLRRHDLLNDFAKAFNEFLAFYNGQLDAKKGGVTATEESILAAVESLQLENLQSAEPQPVAANTAEV